MKAVAWAEMVDLPENRSAVLAAKRCLRPLLKPEGAAPAPHPLLIHGQAGTGKSLLVGLMLRRLTAHPAGITARSLAARELPRRKPDSPKDEGNADFADLLALDFLAVEDAQHLPARAVPGFVELLDHRAARRRVTVVTASAGPANLTRLPRRLTSRLAGGLVVQLGAVGRASRWVLLLRVAERKGLSLTDEAITAVVDATAGGGLRPMLGVLDSLKTVTRGKSSLARPLDAAAVRSLLESAQAPDAGTPIEVIIAHVAAAYGVTAKELLGPSRRRDTLLPRHVAMYLARETTPLSLPQIGAAFGGRDHTTVLHACRKIATGLKADAKLARTLRELKAEIS